MTAAAGRRSALEIAGLDQIAMATGAAGVKGLSERGDVVFFSVIVTFLAAALFSFDVYEPAGLVFRHMMTLTAADGWVAGGMELMGKRDLRPSQVAEDIVMGQDIVGFLGHRPLPPDGTNQYRTD